jgi:hypothetical protein
MNKLTLQYKKRNEAISNWEIARISEAEKGYMAKKDLDILKKRTTQRLEFGKKKTDNYRSAVRELYKDYAKRYRERQLNKF